MRKETNLYRSREREKPQLGKVCAKREIGITLGEWGNRTRKGIQGAALNL